MSLVDRIEAIIKEKGLTFKQVEREAGIGNGTIKRWQNQSPRLDVLIKVSDYLQTSLNSLVYESSCSETMCDGVPLDEDERDLIAMCRLLDDRDRQTVFDIATMKYEQCTGKRGSPYSTYIDTDPHKSGPKIGFEASSVTA